MRRPAAYGITGTLLGLVLGAVFGVGSFFASFSVVNDYQLSHASSKPSPLVALAITSGVLGLVVMVWAIACAVKVGRRLDATPSPISGGERLALWSWIGVVLLPLLLLALAFSYNLHLEDRKELRRQASKEIRAHYHQFTDGEYHIPEDAKTLTLVLNFDGPTAGEYTISGFAYDCAHHRIDVKRVVQLPAGRHQESFDLPGAWAEGKYDRYDGRREWDQRVSFSFEIDPKLLPADAARLRDLGSTDGRLDPADRDLRVGPATIPCSAEPPAAPPAETTKPARTSVK